MTKSNGLASTVAILALALAGPAFAQTSSTANTTGASGDNSDTTVFNVNRTVSRTRTDTLTDNSQRNGNIRLVADQSLDASISNERALHFNGDSANYTSGSNSVNGSAFAAYSGILNQGWNTGINSNTQAATNMAAQGTTSFTTH